MADRTPHGVQAIINFDLDRFPSDRELERIAHRLNAVTGVSGARVVAANIWRESDGARLGDDGRWFDGGGNEVRP